jgi:hypothetical protein
MEALSMLSREAAFVGGGVAPRRNAPPSGWPAARPGRATPPLQHPANARWTARKSVLVAFSGAAMLWGVLFGARNRFGG